MTPSLTLKTKTTMPKTWLNTTINRRDCMSATNTQAYFYGCKWQKEQSSRH